MEKLFGTDGMRGIANVHPITPETAMQIGRALAFLVKEKNKGGPSTILIGKDTRLSGYMLENAMAAGICSMGVNVQLVGPLPTPGTAFITTSMRADAGVVISASHNPFQDNGIKIFSADGFKLPDKTERKIEQLVYSQELSKHRPVAEEIGRAVRVDDSSGRYIVALKNTFPKQYVLDDFHIVLDCAQGAAYKVAPHVFTELGARVTTLGVTPDGMNINQNCGALHPEHMAAQVVQLGANIGLALDGDADRLIVCDEQGKIVDGDHIMAICAQDLLLRRKLRKKTLVATVMSNMGLELAMQKMEGRLIRCQVGDRYVVETMRKGRFSFGGEQSGHLIFLEHNTTGDGTLAALQLLAIMIKKRKPLSELATLMESFPQVLCNVRMTVPALPQHIPGFTDALTQAEKKLGNKGRILVRPSGTEPVLRIMVEGEDEMVIKELATDLCEIAHKAS
jgi:phosphoglucosamine mutase